MSHANDERLAGWMHVTSIPGGWLVDCRLCGKRFKRSFMAANTDYATAERSSREHAAEHLESGPHKAALSAFHADESAEPSKTDKMLADIWDKPLPDARTLRRRAAKSAAMAAKRDEQQRAHAEASANAPRCPICDLPVSQKPEKADERVELPSGAFVHIKCAEGESEPL